MMAANLTKMAFSPAQGVSNWFHVIWNTLRSRPRDSILMVVLLSISGVMEAVALAIILPLLNFLLGEEGGFVQEVITSFLALVGIPLSLGALVVLLIVVALIKAGVVLIAQKKVGDAVTGIGQALRLDFIDALSRASWPFFVSQSSGELSNSLTFEVENASNTYFHSARLLADVIISGFYVISVALLSPVAAFASLIIAPAMIYLMRSLIHMAEKAGREQTRLLKESSRVLVDLLAGFKVLKASGREGVLVSTLTEINNDLVLAKRREVLA